MSETSKSVEQLLLETGTLVLFHVVDLKKKVSVRRPIMQGHLFSRARSALFLFHRNPRTGYSPDMQRGGEPVGDHPGAGKLRLQDEKLIAEAGRPILGCERMRQPGESLAHVDQPISLFETSC